MREGQGDFFNTLHIFSGFSVGSCINEEEGYPFRLSALFAAPFAQMMTGAFSRNIGKLFSELKLVTDNLPLHFAYCNNLKPRWW